jgi:STE24 endopeptidase
VSRRIERARTCTRSTSRRDPTTFAASQRRLALTNLSDLEPHPLAYALFATHPSTTERLGAGA